MYRLRPSLTRLVLAALCAIGIVSCGGGGGGSDGSAGGSNGNPSTTGFKVSGSIAGGGAGTSVKLEGPAGQTVSAGADGNYAISNVTPGTYTVTPTDSSGTYAPASRQVSVSSADVVVGPFARQIPEDGEGLTSEQLAILDAEPEVVVLPAQATSQKSGAGGTGSLSKTAAEEKTLAIDLMVAKALDYACTRSGTCNPKDKWQFKEESPVAPKRLKRPAQNGLAYVFGSKNPLDRTEPQGVCASTYELYGTDCSGLVSLLAAAAQIQVLAGSTSQQKPESWTLPAAWGLRMELVKDGTYERGDFVAWRKHIGIAVTGGSDPAIVSSTGGDNADSCETNRQPPRGPRSLALSSLKKGLGAPLAVLRMKDLSSFSGPVSLTGAATIPNCTGTMTWVGTAKVKLDPTPTISLDGTETFSLCGGPLTVNRQTATFALARTGNTFQGQHTTPFTCEAPCVSGSHTFSPTLELTTDAATGASSLNGSLVHTNTNRTPLNATASGHLVLQQDTTSPP